MVISRIIWISAANASETRVLKLKTFYLIGRSSPERVIWITEARISEITHQIICFHRAPIKYAVRIMPIKKPVAKPAIQICADRSAH